MRPDPDHPPAAPSGDGDGRPPGAAARSLRRRVLVRLYLESPLIAAGTGILLLWAHPDPPPDQSRRSQACVDRLDYLLTYYQRPGVRAPADYADRLNALSDRCWRERTGLDDPDDPTPLSEDW